ncbi:MAG: helix-turn-helix transcriptional regulator [Bdellovibrionales bacterium]|nr:helix-turn-helix transcriptional regulator [Bdellovibrionales bacterium]
METEIDQLKSSHSVRPIDYYELSRMILKQLRGDLTQRELSHLLDYSFNQVGKWESGAKILKWQEFIEVLMALEFPVERQMRSYFGNYKGTFSEPDFLRNLITFFGLNLTDNKKIQKLTKKWENSTTSPDLAEILLVFDSRPSMLVGFLLQYVDCRQIKPLSDRFQIFLKQLESLSEDPNVGFVNEALKLEDYKKLSVHNDDLLARHSGCTVKALKITLSKQLESGAVVFDGKKYHPSPFDYSFSTLNNPKLRTFNKYTFDFVAKKYPVSTDDKVPGPLYNSSTTSSRVIALSKKASEKIDKLVSQFHSEVGEIVKNDDDPKLNVQVITLVSMVAAVKNKSELIDD